MKRIVALLLTAAMLLGALPFGVFADNGDYQSVYRATGDYIERTYGESLGFDDEWLVIGMIRSGREIPDSYYADVEAYVRENINESSQLHKYKSSDNARLILALTAMGKDVTNVAGYNLLEGLNSLSYLKKQGINGVIWALCAADCHDYELPVSREEMIGAILADQLSDGGWSLMGEPSDPDLTAMAITTLAPHYAGNSSVHAALDRAVDFLSSIQDTDGGFTTYDEATAESCAQVIMALSAMGIDAHKDARFIKDGNSVIDALCGYFVAGGGFEHMKDMGLDDLATEQGYYALCAYDRFVSGKTSLLDLRDVTIQKEEAPTEPSTEPTSEPTTEPTTEPSTEPTEETGPSETTKPTEETEPSESTDPSETTEPTEETDPSETTEPTEEADPSESTDPSETTEPTDETDPSETTEPTEETEESTAPVNTITVSFTVLGDYAHEEGTVHTLANGNLTTWVGTKDYEVEDGATVKDVLELVLRANGLSWSNPSGSYVASINGLSEFDNGAKSGWMYSVNGNHSSMSVAQYILKDGDSVIFHYTDDFTLEQGSSGGQTDQSAAEEVEKKINAIGTVTLDSEEKIKAARTAYDALTAAQKKLVDNYSKLTDAEKKLEQLKASDEDKKKAQEVKKRIDAIGENVELATEWKIKEARTAYDALTAQQKALVDNYSKLTTAENKLARLKMPSAEEVYQATGDYLSGLSTPIPGAVGGEWMVLGLIRSGREVPEDYYAGAVEYVQANINEEGRLHRAKVSENARMVLALTALGMDVTNVGGYNLLTGMADQDFAKKQGHNGPIWVLLAFDCANYEIPGGNVTREWLIEYLLEVQLDDGGWALTGDTSDADMTGMALQALAPYYNENEKVKNAVDIAVNKLSEMQNADGGYSSIDGPNCESISQVIVGLTALGIDPNMDPRFIKNDLSAVDALCGYFVTGGGFRHLLDAPLDGMATEQGYYALTAYFRLKEGKTALYDMSDVEISKVEQPGEEITEPTETSGTTETTQTETQETEPEMVEEQEENSLWLLWVFLLGICAAVVAILLVKKNTRQGKYAK